MHMHLSRILVCKCCTARYEDKSTRALVDCCWENSIEALGNSVDAAENGVVVTNTGTDEPSEAVLY
jgi:hypothetical protein